LGVTLSLHHFALLLAVVDVAVIVSAAPANAAALVPHYRRAILSGAVVIFLVIVDLRR